MSENNIKATIQENNDGAYYHVQLQTVPSKGDKISLFSYLDQSTGHESNHSYEVISIIHKIKDVTDKVSKSEGGYHSVTIIVKPC
ncbi:hypothetical protein VXS05_18370 [Photobacterium toruni]|uniref:hypothetical protein n=1 Tax=Photobacterium toruni TaxID=1935446 RepID=UPI002E1719E0|nr:hypothetical protein [Photobacterium toruni]